MAALVAVRGVPDRVVAWSGGPSGVDRAGGLVLRYRPPADADLSRFERANARRGTVVRREGPVLHVDVPGIGELEAIDMAATLTRGGLEFRKVIESRSLAVAAPQVGIGEPMVVAPGVTLEIESWKPDAGERHTDCYLAAASPADLERGFEAVRAAGWVQPPDTIVAFERIDASPGGQGVQDRPSWRSYLLGDDVLLDGDAVAHAVRASDPNTGQPIVLVEFTPEGAARFAQITEQIEGGKLAWMLGGRVRFAPFINGPIRGGRASIALGSGDVLQQEAQAEAMIAAIAVVPLPPGGTIEDQRWVAPASIAARLALLVIAIALIAGGLVGLVVGLAVRIARPSWRPRVRRGPGGLSGRRIAVTLLAPASLIALGQLAWPGINEDELWHVLYGAHLAPQVFTIAELGVRPVISAFLLVELFTLVTARWRRVRLLPAWRIVLGRYVAVIGIAIAVLQAYLAVGHLALLNRGEVEVFAPDLWTHAAAIASLASGTMLLVIVAGVIRQHGLGNGYGALLVGEWVLTVARPIMSQPTAGHLLGLVALIAIGGATVALLRMEVGDDGEAPLRVPSSSIAPLAGIGAVLALWLAIRVGPGALLEGGWTTAPIDHAWLVLGSLVVLVPLWSFAFSRPAVVAPLAAHTALAAPGQPTWRRATLLTWLVLSLVSAASLLAAATHGDALVLCDATMAMMVAAVALDIADDLRARRADLVTAWPLHQAQHAALVQRVLADAGIECHLRAGHLRTLLGFFGPHVPIDVLVPAASVGAARSKIATLYGETPLDQVFA